MGKPSETSAREEAVDYVLAADEEVGPTGSDKVKTKHSDKKGEEQAPLDPSMNKKKRTDFVDDIESPSGLGL